MAPGAVPLEIVLAELLAVVGASLGPFALALARVTPAVALVPAFGPGQLPASTRAVLAAAFALVLAPAFPARAELPSALALLSEVAAGLPVAVAAAAALWGASLVGGLADELRAAREAPPPRLLGEAGSPSAYLVGTLAALLFLRGGGPERLLFALLSAPPPDASVLAALVVRLVAAVQLALAIGAPLLVVAAVGELIGALISRASRPAQLGAVLAPLRSLLVLVAFALLLDRIVVLTAV